MCVCIIKIICNTMKSIAIFIAMLFFVAGSFDAYAKECTVWALTDLQIMDADGNAVGTMQTGVGYKAEVTETQVTVKDGEVSGSVDQDHILVDLADFMPGETLFYIHYAVSAFATIHNHAIETYAGTKLYPYVKKADGTFYVPFMLNAARHLKEAEYEALSLGYTLKIYDAYRPYPVTQLTFEKMEEFVTERPEFKAMMTEPVNGKNYGLNWFLAKNESSHNYGCAVDIALCDSETRKNIPKQSQICELSTRSVPDMSSIHSSMLRQIMTSCGFGTLESEWWHFDMKEFKRERGDFQTGEHNAF